MSVFIRYISAENMLFTHDFMTLVPDQYCLSGSDPYLIFIEVDPILVNKHEVRV